MPKRNDGNEQDLRIRSDLDAPSLEGDNPMTGAIPDDKSRCSDGYGSQTDIEPETIEIDTPSGVIRYDWTDVSHICPRGFDNNILNILFMRLLKNHFSKPDCIFYEAVKQFVYDEDPQKSGIRIVMNTTFDPAQEEQMPSIIVKRGNQKPQRVVMGDRGERAEWLDGEERYTRFITGNHRLLIAGYGDGFVEDLAQEVFDFLNAVSPVMRTDLPFHDFQIGPMTELGVMAELGNRFAVAIDVIYTYEYSWTIQRRAARFGRSAVDLQVQLQRVISRPGDV